MSKIALYQTSPPVKELASLRDWLLPLLMNGQVGFREAEDGQ